MRTMTGTVAFLLLGLAANAQTESPPRKETGPVEKLWKIEASGISG